MAHFAKINLDNIVEQVIVVSNCALNSCIGKDHWDYQEEYHADHTGTADFPEQEALGQKVLADSGFEGTWKQTSYNTRAGVHYGPDGTPDGKTQYRGNHAGVGMIYDATHDAFIVPQPSPTAVLNTTTFTWEEPSAPTA